MESAKAWRGGLGRAVATVVLLVIGTAWVSARGWAIPWRERLLEGPASAAAARALAGCYEYWLSPEPTPRWMPLVLVRVGPDGPRTGPFRTWLDAAATDTSAASAPLYLVRDAETGASRADHWYWAPLSGGGFVWGIRGYGHPEDALVHPAGAGGEFGGRVELADSYLKIVLRRVDCPTAIGDTGRAAAPAA